MGRPSICRFTPRHSVTASSNLYAIDLIKLNYSVSGRYFRENVRGPFTATSKNVFNSAKKIEASISCGVEI